MESGKDITERHFNAARRRAFWNRVVRFLTGRSNRLIPWGEVQDELHLQDFVEKGVVAVPLERIVGSVGRYNEFDRAFMPKLDSTAPRWRSIASAILSAVSLPPVTLYRVGNSYFVIDGHHRVSVARELNQRFIDAHVIEARARAPLPTDLDADHLQIAGEHIRFLEFTRLDVLRPDQNLTFTSVGAYCWALKHIALHRQTISRMRGQRVTQDQAVKDWYDRIYLPLVRRIRHRDLLAEFPHRTEADLFLWIVDHQHDLSEQCGWDVSEERAADHLAYRYTHGPIKRAMRTIRAWVAGPKCLLIDDQGLSGTDEG